MKVEDLVNKWRTTEETVLERENFLSAQMRCVGIASAYISTEECSKEL